jgi:2'-5' RNA ligase
MEQEDAYRRVWETFRAMRRLADGRHDTADWRSHEGVYAVCVVRIPKESIRATLEPCRAALATFPFVRVHPDDFLHVTLQELGFVCDEPGRVDEITPARLEEFAVAAAGPVNEEEAFDLTLGGANSFQDAAFLEVHDRDRCARLHRRLFELAAIPRAPRFAYLPHVTIAHYTGDVPSGGVAAALGRWHDEGFGTFRVTEVEIVTLRLDEPYPSLESYGVIPLEG